ncbi:hypothetical protein SBY92_005136 [Candida maltosa Xu316]|uniref:Uncharacterized protein n=1 Tax=Candida maltosa (strain Xu316) TaxID=1245528 RepID=M3JX29_CANMX|nr:hypothetical protein G210_2774 [Candida maltosa Xu316]
MLGLTSKRIAVSGLRTQIRLNSSTNGKDVSFNLDDIFKRIDQVTVKAVEIKKKLDSEKALKRINMKNRKISGNETETTGAPRSSQPRRNFAPRRDQQDGEQSAQRQPSSGEPRGDGQKASFNSSPFKPRDGSFTPRDGSYQPRSYNRERGDQGNRRVSGSNQQGRNGPRGSNRAPRQVPRVPAVAKPITSKQLKPESLKPEITPEKFFYGKVPSVGATVSSRLASIAKLSLEDSKYPYMLPKNVIDQASPTKHNKFILQKNWNIEPDTEIMKERVQTIVLGQKRDFQIPGEKTELAVKTAHNININPTLNADQKSSMFNIVNGLVDIKNIFKDAHWKKSATK